MANKEILLPSGATATLKDPKSFKQKDRAKLYAGIDGDNPGLERGMMLMDGLIAISVESWTLDLIPPSVKPESIGELSIDDYDALQEECQKFMPLLFPQLAATVEGEADPKVTSGNSKD